MEKIELQQTIAQLLPEAQFNTGSQYLEVRVTPEKLHDAASKLMHDDSVHFDFLACQRGVDIKGELGVVYQLRSLDKGYSCVLKVFTSNRENPEVDTVSDLWRSAEYFEREIYDMIGIRFKNHPDMRRLFLEDNFKGFPLRKDFTDEVNIIER